jgi:hypothetical protein
MSTQDLISGWYKEALRGRIRALSIIAELLIEKNAQYLRGDARQPRALSQVEAIERLQERLGLRRAKGQVSRLVKSAWVRLPDGSVWPLAEFFERPKGFRTACEIFFTLAAYYEEEQEEPYSDGELAQLRLISTKRSNIQKARGEWLPNSQERARLYREGKDFPDLLKGKVGDDPKKLRRLLEVLEEAQRLARTSQEARARQAQRRLEGWLKTVRAWEQEGAGPCADRGR